MKKISFACVALLFGGVLHVSAQEESKKLQLNDVSFSFSLTAEQSPKLLLIDLRQIAPQSQILAKDFSAYSYSSYDTYSGPTSKINILAGFDLGKNETKKGQTQLRIGFGWISNYNSKTTLSKKEIIRYDTLVSLQTGTHTYLDSVYYDNYTASHNYDRLQLEASLIYRTNPLLRWSLYGGFGIAAGGSLTNNLVIENTKYDNFSKDEYHTMWETTFFPEQREVNKTKRVFGGGLYIPLGVDFRLAKKHELLSKMHVFYEACPGVSITYVPDVAIYAGTFVSFGTQILGLRVVL